MQMLRLKEHFCYAGGDENTTIGRCAQDDTAAAIAFPIRGRKTFIYAIVPASA
jgi:hypothetical protein